MGTDREKEIFLQIGKLLDYPTSHLEDQGVEAIQMVQAIAPEASVEIAEFVESAGRISLGRMEEIYTSTFDVSPTCYIFAGYMLFGESFKRGEFLVGLQEKYAERNFSRGKELADHLAVLFRFLATLDENEPLRAELLEDCMLPVITKMLASFKSQTERENPYAHLLRAIEGILEYFQGPTNGKVDKSVLKESFA